MILGAAKRQGLASGVISNVKMLAHTQLVRVLDLQGSGPGLVLVLLPAASPLRVLVPPPNMMASPLMETAAHHL
jgi:hypothetical protein